MNPILKTTLPSLGWDLNTEKSPTENLEELLQLWEAGSDAVKANKLPISAHTDAKQLLSEASNSTGNSSPEIAYLHKTLLQMKADGKASEIEKDIQSLSDAVLLQQLVLLQLNLQEVREHAVSIAEEAYAEVEARYCVKVSLYNLERGIRLAKTALSSVSA